MVFCHVILTLSLALTLTLTLPLTLTNPNPNPNAYPINVYNIHKKMNRTMKDTMRHLSNEM